MRLRFPSWLVLIALAAVCAGVVLLVAHWRQRQNTAAALVARMPLDNAPLVFVDFGALRAAGILDMLQGADVQEPEYRAFVDESGFDYQQDLDLALVSFHSTGTYFLLEGRFDWKALSAYAVKQGGDCHNMMCRMAGSTPDRFISFYPVSSDIMALAVSPDNTAAENLKGRGRMAPPLDIPDRPVWSLIPASALRKRDKLPAGTQMFARQLETAERVLFSAGPSASGIELQMDVTCRDPNAAADLVGQLRGITKLVSDLIAREKQQPSGSDLSGVLTAGRFEQQDRKVIGRWPVERRLIESLVGRAGL